MLHIYEAKYRLWKIFQFFKTNTHLTSSPVCATTRTTERGLVGGIFSSTLPPTLTSIHTTPRETDHSDQLLFSKRNWSLDSNSLYLCFLKDCVNAFIFKLWIFVLYVHIYIFSNNQSKLERYTHTRRGKELNMEIRKLEREFYTTRAKNGNCMN